MDSVSKLVPFTENLKSAAHFIFEKMELHDGLGTKNQRGGRIFLFRAGVRIGLV